MENEANENYCQRVIDSSSSQNIDRSLYLGINDVSKMYSLTVLTSDRYIRISQEYADREWKVYALT